MINPLPPDISEEYGRLLYEAVAPFERQPITQLTLASLHQAAEEARTSFVYAHPEYTTIGDVVISEGEAHRFFVNAPICTLAEKMEIKYRERERQRLLAELEAKDKIREAKARRSRANMLRRHRKLMARHAERITPSVRRIWGSLTAGQQYAILKDIDWAVRHQS